MLRPAAIMSGNLSHSQCGWCPEVFQTKTKSNWPETGDWVTGCLLGCAPTSRQPGVTSFVGRARGVLVAARMTLRLEGVPTGAETRTPPVQVLACGCGCGCGYWYVFVARMRGERPAGWASTVALSLFSCETCALVVEMWSPLVSGGRVCLSLLNTFFLFFFFLAVWLHVAVKPGDRCVGTLSLSHKYYK